VLKRLGVKKKIGWHSFRHRMANLLRQCGVDVKVAQDLLRHANSRITMDIYQQTVTEERRQAQALAFNDLWPDDTKNSSLSRDRTLPNPNRATKEEVIPLIN
jgi:integrase